MTWQIAVLSFLIFGTAGNLLRRYLAVELQEHNRLINACFYVGIFSFGLFVSRFLPHNMAIGWENFLFILIGSAMFPIYSIFAFKANEKIDAGLFNIINNITPLVTIAVATVLLNETMTSAQILGGSIIIGSAFLATLPKLKHHMRANAQGLILAVISVSILGLAIVFEKWMLGRIDMGSYLVYGWGSQALWMVALAWNERGNLKLLAKPKVRKPVILYVVTNSLKGLSFVSALKLSSNASLISAVTSFLAVSIVISAYFVLGEKEHLWLKLSAALLGTVGLIVVYTA